jgi:ACDE family multidrug resistance protein
MKQKKWDLFALATIPLGMTLGSSMFIPVLPTIEKELNITPFQSSLIITVYSIIAIFLIPFAGYLSDKIGRKKVIIPSLILTGIGGGLSTFAAWKLQDPYFFILIGRFIQGIGASGAFPVVIPTVGDMFKNKKEVSKGLGIIETANTFGKVLSPILGSLLATVVWFFPFAAIPFISLLSIVLVVFLVKPPKSNHKETKEFKQFMGTIKDIFKYNGRWLIGVFIIGCISMFILFSFQFHLSNLLEKEYKINGILRGVLLAIPLLFLCIASFWTGQKISENKLLMKWIVFFGYISVFCSLLFLQPAMKLPIIITLLTIAAIGIGVSLPCLDSLITEGIEKEERGTITSFYSSMRFIGVAAGPPFVAIIMNRFSDLVYPSLAVVGAIASLITIFFIKPDTKREQNGLAKNVDIGNGQSSLFRLYKIK